MEQDVKRNPELPKSPEPLRPVLRKNPSEPRDASRTGGRRDPSRSSPQPGRPHDLKVDKSPAQEAGAARRDADASPAHPGSDPGRVNRNRA
jgi:hypothetical protein